jgi:hypothetical protein
MCCTISDTSSSVSCSEFATYSPSASRRAEDHERRPRVPALEAVVSRTEHLVERPEIVGIGDQGEARPLARRPVDHRLALDDAGAADGGAVRAG